LLALSPIAGPLRAQTGQPDMSGSSVIFVKTGSSTLDLPVGQSRVLKFNPITRAAIGNPSVADIAVLSKTEVLLNAKAPGETLLYVQSGNLASSITVRVAAAPTADLSTIVDDINRALTGTGVTATVAGNTVFLRGQVNTQPEEQQAVAIAKAFTPNVQSFVTVGQVTPAAITAMEDILKPMGLTVRNPSGNVIILEGAASAENLERVKALTAQIGAGYQIVNLVTDTLPSRQIVIHARVVDMDQGALRDLGIDWGTLLVDQEGKLTGVGQPVIFGEANIKDRGLGEGGPIRRLENIGAAVQALETANRAKILSAPDILVRDNRPATILVGGEIPVPVPQVGSGANVMVSRVRS
jgi:Flp pilus assembly secretin CpaC